MNKKQKIELVLEGLQCANCASKIENRVNALDKVDRASMNFTNKVLTIDFLNDNQRESILNEIKDIVNKLEPDVKVVERNKQVKNKQSIEEVEEQIKNRKKIITIMVGTISAIMAFFMQNNFKVQLSLYILSYFLIGGDVLLKAFKNIIKGEVFDENFLMAIATVGAITIKEYPEAVAVMLFYQVGEMFQDYAVDRSRKSITALVDIRPEFANLQREGNIEKVSPEHVKVGDIIVVKPGEKIPLDGIVIEGESFLDTSILTGESVDRRAKKGEQVLSGFINKTSLLKVEVNKSFKDSAVSKILDMVENAGTRKAPTENFITKFARYYTPIVVLSALALAFIPPIFIKGAVFSDWIYRALIFLVISCPCALVVSIPLGFFGGIGACSGNGILVKGGNYLEALNSLETVVFDKTGTLTKGEFKVSKIVPLNEFSKEELLEVAAKGESFSNHPIAVSILNSYDKDVPKESIKDYEEIAGKGIKAFVDDKELLLGNSKLMDMYNIDYKELSTAGTIVYIALDGGYAGYIIISDEIKEDSTNTILGLKKLGISIAMLTGDNKAVSDKVAKELNIDKVYAELLPQDKMEKLEEIFKDKTNKGKILFVGDGVNDAPVLARADIGVAMGALGSDAAIEAADVVIMTDEPSKILTAVNIAKNTRKIVWENIIFALGIKLIVLILGAIGLANMWQAVFADVGVALIAVLNSMRTLSFNNR